MLAIGLMSGTSVDGVDVALCEITGFKKTTRVRLLRFETIKYDEETRCQIKELCDPKTSDIANVCSLNFKLGYIFSNAVKKVCDDARVEPKQLAFIASHGQTICHIPKATNEFYASTLQIGEASIIAYEHNVDVISDFRVMDIAAGGEGAPLVPYSEYILYHNEKKHIALQNIGGIGNVTMLYANGGIDNIIAFDTGPGNMMIDEACMQLFQKNYDDKGKIARLYEIEEDMLMELLQHPYFKKAPPKSTGREAFGCPFVRALLQKYKHVAKGNIITTLTAFTAKSISKQYRKFIFPKGIPDHMIIAGGGAHNCTLVEMIRKELPECNVLIQEDIGYSSDAEEAIAFVILGNEALFHNENNVKVATGANASVVLGKITKKARNIY